MIKEEKKNEMEYNRKKEEMEKKEKEQQERMKIMEEQERMKIMEEQGRMKKMEEQERMKKMEEQERMKKMEEAPQFFVCQLCGRMPRGCVVLDMNCGGLVGCERCLQQNYSAVCVRCGRAEKYQVLTTGWEIVLKNSGAVEIGDNDRKLEYFEET